MGESHGIVSSKKSKAMQMRAELGVFTHYVGQVLPTQNYVGQNLPAGAGTQKESFLTRDAARVFAPNHFFSE